MIEFRQFQVEVGFSPSIYDTANGIPWSASAAPARARMVLHLPVNSTFAAEIKKNGLSQPAFRLEPGTSIEFDVEPSEHLLAEGVGSGPPLNLWTLSVAYYPKCACAEVGE